LNLVQLKLGTELDVILGLVKEFLASHRVGRFKVMDIGYHVLVKGDTAGSSAANVNSSLCGSSGGGSLELFSVLNDGGSHLSSSVWDVVRRLFLFRIFGIVRKMSQDDHSHVLYPDYYDTGDRSRRGDKSHLLPLCATYVSMVAAVAKEVIADWPQLPRRSLQMLRFKLLSAPAFDVVRSLKGKEMRSCKWLVLPEVTRYTRILPMSSIRSGAAIKPPYVMSFGYS